MATQPELDNAAVFEELQELVAIEVKDILATAAEEGYSPRDVVGALELALQAEIEALANPDGAKANQQPELPLATAQ